MREQLKKIPPEQWKKFGIAAGTILLIFALFSINCGSKNLQKGFVDLDRAYITALALTDQPEVEPAKQAIKMLEHKWARFKGEFYNYNSEDPQWKSDLDYIEEFLITAKTLLEIKDNNTGAHEMLEKIGYVFLRLRKRNSMTYYLDYLHEFREPMEAIMATVKDKDPETITSVDIAKIKILLPQALEYWGEIEKAEFNPKLFDFDAKKLAAMENYINLESQALSELGQALESEDRGILINRASAIKMNFVELFLLFGNFDAILRKESAR